MIAQQNGRCYVPVECFFWYGKTRCSKGPFTPSVSVNAATTLPVMLEITVLIENNGVILGYSPFSSNSIVTARKWSCGTVMGPVMFLLMFVFLHFGVCLPTMPWGRQNPPPTEDRPPPPAGMVNRRAVRILRECILVFYENNIGGVTTELSQRRWRWYLV